MNQPKRPSFPARLGPPSAQNAVRPMVRPAGNAAPRSAAPMPAPRGVGLDSAAVRGRMVQRLAASGISSAAVLQAMGSVERHLFVDTALVNQAYEDTSLPIGLA